MNAFQGKHVWESHLLGQGTLSSFAGSREEGDGQEGTEDREKEKIGAETDNHEKQSRMVSVSVVYLPFM